MLKIALPKGRMGQKVYDLLARADYAVADIFGDNRKLVFEDLSKGISYILVKPSDVAVYVEHGAADIGVVGKDTLLEYSPDVYEIADLKMGVCRLAVATPNNFVDDLSLPLRVATKYPNVARRYYGSMQRQIEIIKLHGSIELAPLVGLSDVIVDIVETGSTLRENGLSVKSEIAPSSARLIVNKASYQFKTNEIKKIKEALETAI